MASIDPTTLATQLATAQTQSAQALLDAQNKSATAISSALTKLQTALRAFDTALDKLSDKKSLNQLAATVSGSQVTATASPSAAPGSYSIFVERLASNHQIAFQDLPATEASAAGTLTLSLRDGSSFEVALNSADTDGNGSLSYAEIARAINLAEDNGGKISASVATVGGKAQLLLSSGVGGEDGEITVAASGSSLDTQLNAAPMQLAAARNAVAWLGGEGGMRIEQGSNTLTAISGLSITLTAAQASGSAPSVVNVAQDSSGTKANLQSFIDAYNALEKSLDELTAIGSGGGASAAFASDAGVRALRSRLSNTLRQEFDGLSLRSLGIHVDRGGQLSLDSAKLDKTLATRPDALDTVFGNTSLSAPRGLMGAMVGVVDQWTNSTKGQIQQRQSSLQALQKSISTRQTRLDTQYESAFQRYLKQFSALQEMQLRMEQTSGLLSSLSTS